MLGEIDQRGGLHNRMHLVHNNVQWILHPSWHQMRIEIRASFLLHSPSDAPYKHQPTNAGECKVSGGKSEGDSTSVAYLLKLDSSTPKTIFLYMLWPFQDFC